MPSRLIHGVLGCLLLATACEPVQSDRDAASGYDGTPGYDAAPANDASPSRDDAPEPAADAGSGYYVDAVSGDDTRDGRSAATAWRTLDRINGAAFAAGDAVFFARGSTWSGTAIRVATPGLTLAAYGTGARPIVRNPGALNAVDITAPGVTVVGLAFADTTVFSGATIRTENYTHSGAVMIEPTGSHATIRDCDFARVGVGVKSYAPDTVVTHNVFRDAIIAWRSATQSYGAIGVSLNSSNAVVSYNQFTNCRSTDSPYGADGGAIEIEGFAAVKDAIAIHHNVSRGSQGFLEVTETRTTNVTLSYNVSDDYQQFIAFDTTTVPTNFRVEHNTIVRTRAMGATNVFAIFFYRALGAAPTDAWLSFRNNVFYTPAAKILRGTRSPDSRLPEYDYPHDHNLYFDDTADPLGHPLGLADRVAGPRFVDLANGDYHLGFDSPAIDSGVDLGYALDADDDPARVGAAPDLGAFEYPIADPSFESARALVPFWVPDATDGTFGIDADAGNAYSGADNAWIATRGSGWNALSQSVSVHAQSRYTFSVWIQSSGNVADGRVGVRTATGSVLQESRSAVAGGYTQRSVTFDTRENTRVVVYAGYVGPGAASWLRLDGWSRRAN